MTPSMMTLPNTATWEAEAPTPRPRTPQTRVVAVASGKGGVGKTNLTINLGIALAKRGVKVAILDADLGTANVDVLLGIQPRYHLHHVITGQKTLPEIVVEGPYGLHIIPGASGLPAMVDLPENQREALLRSLTLLDGNVDLLLIDSSAGVDRNVMQFILAANELLLVTNTEPTAITDAYALLKVLMGYERTCNVKLAVNSVHQRREGEHVARNFAQVAQRFLGCDVEVLGCIPWDKSVIEAVWQQSPLLESRPRSAAAQAIETLADRLWTGNATQSSPRGLIQFFRHLLSPLQTAASY